MPIALKTVKGPRKTWLQRFAGWRKFRKETADLRAKISRTNARIRSMRARLKKAVKKSERLGKNLVPASLRWEIRQEEEQLEYLETKLNKARAKTQ